MANKAWCVYRLYGEPVCDSTPKTPFIIKMLGGGNGGRLAKVAETGFWRREIDRFFV